MNECQNKTKQKKKVPDMLDNFRILKKVIDVDVQIKSNINKTNT